ncbi:16S rRNA (Guanine(966)-N(2))-methyltransferase [uncultured Alphaproteobacteria bacterium]|uniref:16S rRNA (Guanine(966)-N(2))-methyltransferase n=1 Tax=uncultured Alphaproteobacteria bacterium TaxID=91750 RepID=A0A212KLF7_9PROT|nr:16S rRNA (Guanine(966)-N(2))-methyltransferase [uncultured Alphaproteobacteria bacterium]
MRIVAGRNKGRILAAPEGGDTRPTSDRAREALFNILAHRYAPEDFSLHGARVLDLFAGTGALGLEAWSRGAAHVTFVERDAAALKALAANLRATRAEAEILRADATHPPRAKIACDLVFLDPPYAEGVAAAALAAADAAGWVRAGAVAVAETAAADAPVWPPGFVVDDRRVYGKAALTFLRRA